MDFFITSEYPKYPICSFSLACYNARAPISFMNYFVEYTIKVARKVNSTGQTI